MWIYKWTNKQIVNHSILQYKEQGEFMLLMWASELKSKLLAKSLTHNWYLVSGSYCYFYSLAMSSGPSTVQHFQETRGYPGNKGGAEEGRERERETVEGRKNFFFAADKKKDTCDDLLRVFHKWLLYIEVIVSLTYDNLTVQVAMSLF